MIAIETIDLMVGPRGFEPPTLGPKLQVRQKLNFCHFISCSHHEFIRVMRFFPVRYQRITAMCCDSVHKLATRFWGALVRCSQILTKPTSRRRSGFPLGLINFFSEILQIETKSFVGRFVFVR